MKKLYRTTIFFTETYLSDTPPSNLFVYGKEDEKKEVLDYCISLFKEAATKAGIANAKFSYEIREVSEEELEEYKRGMASGNKTHQLMN